MRDVESAREFPFAEQEKHCERRERRKEVERVATAVEGASISVRAVSCWPAASDSLQVPKSQLSVVITIALARLSLALKFALASVQTKTTTKAATDEDRL